MIARAKEYHLDFNQIDINTREIIDTMGYPNGEAPPHIMEIINQHMEEAKDIVNLKCGFVWLPEGEVSGDGNSVTLRGKVFDTKRIVGVPLRKMTEAILFTATIGHDFDEWSRETFASGDPLGGYIIDLLGSTMAEATTDWLEKEVVKIAQKEGKTCTNRYSPGYCGWSVAEQHQLFSFFPDNFCGISLTPSALMKPHKSTSGIIGVAQNIKRMEYPCDACNVSHCYKNRDKKR